MSKLSIPSGPGNLARRFVKNDAHTEEDRRDVRIAKGRLREIAEHPERLVPIEKVKAEIAAVKPKRRKGPATSVIVRPKRGSGGASAAAGQSKAEKVAAWRKANPEAYAEQKRRATEKRAKAKETAR